MSPEEQAAAFKSMVAAIVPDPPYTVYSHPRLHGNTYVVVAPVMEGRKYPVYYMVRGVTGGWANRTVYQGYKLALVKVGDNEAYGVCEVAGVPKWQE